MNKHIFMTHDFSYLTETEVILGFVVCCHDAVLLRRYTSEVTFTIPEDVPPAPHLYVSLPA